MSLNKTNQLSKAETVALWHAIQWQELCLKNSPVSDAECEKDAMNLEYQRLALAKKALRKINAIRKAQHALLKAAGVSA